MKNTLKTGQVLDRLEMKKIMAGGGNVYCNVGGTVHHCPGTLNQCTQYCGDVAGTDCNGCAQMPQQ